GSSIPLIYVDSPLDETSSFVGTDNRQSFRLMVDYLCRSGEPPCYFAMPLVNNNASARQEAYVEAMRQFKMTTRILKGGGFPTKTVLCANDRVAFGVLGAAYQLGLKVGHGADCDLRVAGHDDHPLSRYACPPITTVAQNYNEIGRLAIELLLARLDEKAAKRESGRILLNA